MNPITFDTVPSGVTYVERDGHTLGCVVHGRDDAGYPSHTFYLGTTAVFSHPDPVTVRRRVRRLLDR